MAVRDDLPRTWGSEPTTRERRRSERLYVRSGLEGCVSHITVKTPYLRYVVISNVVLTLGSDFSGTNFRAASIALCASPDLELSHGC